MGGTHDEPRQIDRIVDPNDAHRTKRLQGYASAEPLLVPVVRKGKSVYRPPPLPAIRERVHSQLDRLHPGHKRFENPHVYPVGISPRLQGIREAMIESFRRQVNSGK